MAGHSLGEYSALVAAGSLRFADAVRLVRNRGQYMQEAVPAGVGAMAAILKLPEGKLEGVLEQAAQGEMVSAANLNSPDQVVIAGHAAAVDRAIGLAKAAGARRAVLLPVSAPFHCALMKPAQERLRVDLDATEFRDLACPLVNNWQAREIRTGAEAREGSVPTGTQPVRWVETVRYLAAQGVARCVEVGAGGVLTGLLRGIDPALDGPQVRRAGGSGGNVGVIPASSVASLALVRHLSCTALTGAEIYAKLCKQGDSVSTESGETKIRCPTCGGRDVRHSQHAGCLLAFMSMLHRIAAPLPQLQTPVLLSTRRGLDRNTPAR